MEALVRPMTACSGTPLVLAGAEGDVHAGRSAGVAARRQRQHGVPGEQHARGVPRLLRDRVPAGGVAGRDLVTVQRRNDESHPRVHCAQWRRSRSLGAHLLPEAYTPAPCSVTVLAMYSCASSLARPWPHSDPRVCQPYYKDQRWISTQQAGAGVHEPAGMDAGREPGVWDLRVRDRRRLRRPRQLRGGERPVLLRRRLDGRGLQRGDAQLHGGAAWMLRWRRH